jgi:hypothetical protein
MIGVEEALLLPVQRNRYAAHCDVEIVGLKSFISCGHAVCVLT